LPKWGDGTLFVGEKGMLLAGYNERRLLPEKDFRDYEAPRPTIPDSVGHYKEWVQACKSGGPTACHFDYAGALAGWVVLGGGGVRLGKGAGVGRGEADDGGRHRGGAVDQGVPQAVGGGVRPRQAASGRRALSPLSERRRVG